ncbi:winged helix-turn-helix transcriptional regulator [Staphylococcus simiae]|uniref:carbohydrate kinase n=1 Tax=Staphylococcus simiae TaxID=308354 RepID=UPI001A97595F|nr:carbohydrate kinase [Staphylococcus simiae]MBO1198752.1 winged helix-turn-helix transcriptional regulator [Staphylococcus simiae]MBO1201004.1 winged helix-turn-helix transcriptional regulator [Staphylococcus simiae]MBO1203151.1 winged helix-turn-helix transcriptional regulator [Staphylococcus simiae]MBO1210741.1 winged helix-turn-helix transcriptional regulator [Staphylococcus simiae]MBO1229342.1 winged helix-turn-helix transcriptional regulator [Staphylococcus simiae]
MNTTEKEILKRIKDNPFISQRELAEAIGLSRPTVANIISGLIQKEYVMGKAYVLNEDYPIVCIGAANVDRKFYVHKELVAETSNPVTSTRSVGGVARNIAENLGRLGETVAFLSASGQDSEWDMVKRLSSPFMNMDHVQQFENASTGSYTALINKQGDMAYGLADMEVFDHITPEFLIKRTHLLKKAKCIIVDLNLSKDALDFLCAYTAKHDINLVITTVSSPKMKNMPDSLHAIDWIITNKDETETFLNVDIDNTDDLKEAAKKWNDLGVSNVIITNGVKELIYRSDKEEIIKSVTPSTNVKDVTGAGDSFCAAVVYSWLNGMSTEDILIAGMVNSSKTIETEYTVRQNLDQQQLYHDMEEYKNDTITTIH